MKNKYFRRVFLIVPVWLFFLQRSSPAETLKTPAEESRYTKYSQHEEIVQFLSRLDFLAPEVSIQVIGKTRETNEFPSQDLFLININEGKAESPEGLNRQKPTILLIASQHGNEQSGKEAALWLARDLAVGELKPLLKEANFLIIPQSNPYGNRFDQRRNEQDLDLNRDHVKLESEEVRAIHRVFRAWMPEVTLDIHERGDNYYRVSLGCVSNVNIDPRLQEFSRKTVLTEVEKNLEKKRVTFHEYLVTDDIAGDPSAAIGYHMEDLASIKETKRFSTTDLNDGRNSLGIYETFSFIQEGASRHDTKTLEERTGWQYLGLRFFVEAIARHGQEILTMVKDIRGRLLERSQVNSENNLVHLWMVFVRDKNNPSLTIKAFEQAQTSVMGILKVDKKAGETVLENELEPNPYPAKNKVRSEIIKDWFPGVVPTLSTTLPLGYVIPAKHQNVIENLVAHGLRVDFFTADQALEVEAYRASEVTPSKSDALPPEKIEVEKRTLGIVAKKGDYFVSCGQAGANLVACLLEPQSQYGLICYWSFKLVPEKGEVFAFYRVIKSEALPVIPYRSWKR
jgi:hypothetical protein